MGAALPHLHRCRRATSLARTPPDRGVVQRGATAVQASRAPRRCGAGSRAPAPAASAWSRPSCPAGPPTSSWESPSIALITSTERWRSGSRWMSPSSARASARRASSSGSCAVSAGMPSSSMSPTARVRPRLSSSTHALWTSRSSQARGSSGTTPPRSAVCTRRKTSCRTSSESWPEAYSSRAAWRRRAGRWRSYTVASDSSSPAAKRARRARSSNEMEMVVVCWGDRRASMVQTCRHPLVSPLLRSLHSCDANRGTCRPRRRL